MRLGPQFHYGRRQRVNFNPYLLLNRNPTPLPFFTPLQTIAGEMKRGQSLKVILREVML